MPTRNILIMGASYGSLLGAKLALAGHNVTLVCLPAEADLINKDGAHIRMPIRGREGLVQIDTSKAPGKLTATGTEGVKPGSYDLIGLAMQEPQYRSPGVRELLDAVAKSRVPCMSIMNMPPLPYVARIPGVDVNSLRDCYTDASVWDNFDPGTLTLCSPDPQAFRPPEEPVNVLQVRLATNFKCARFDNPDHTAMLRELEKDIEAIRFDVGGEKIELPVKLRAHDSIFVPLAKWAMLMAGNYRCITEGEPRPIKDAVHGNLEESRTVYNWVVQLCVKLGADEKDLVPFDKYAEAAKWLGAPSSAARAVAAGMPNIERVDRLVQSLAKQKGMRLDALDNIVALVDKKLEQNRAKAKK
ncbi:MAG TPA: hypothetical protein VGN52_18450 [Burkholderiales bacterium]